MTAINAVVTQNAAHLITDGLLTAPNGLLSMPKGMKRLLGSKCYTLPHIGAAIAIRGPAGLGPAIATEISYIGETFDAVKDGLAIKLKSQFSQPASRGMEKIYGPEWNVLDIVVAGWSQKMNRPDAFFIVTHDNHPGIPAWQTIDTGPFMIAPTRPELLAEFEPRITALIAADDSMLSLNTLAADLIGCQRIIESNVGGFAQVTTVTEDSITSRVVTRYDDKTGERLESVTSPIIRRSRSLSEWMEDHSDIRTHLRN